MDKSPIETTLKRIAEGYRSGTLAQIKKNHPQDWARLLDLEREVNRISLKGDRMEMEKVLVQYESLVFGKSKKEVLEDAYY